MIGLFQKANLRKLINSTFYMYVLPKYKILTINYLPRIIMSKYTYLGIFFLCNKQLHSNHVVTYLPKG